MYESNLQYFNWNFLRKFTETVTWLSGNAIEDGYALSTEWQPLPTAVHRSSYVSVAFSLAHVLSKQTLRNKIITKTIRNKNS